MDIALHVTDDLGAEQTVLALRQRGYGDAGQMLEHEVTGRLAAMLQVALHFAQQHAHHNLAQIVAPGEAPSASLDRSVECVYSCGYNMAALRIGIRELKARAPQVVREVRETGEAVDITYYGEVVARLTPVEAAKEPGTREAAWKEFDAVARAVGKRTGGRARSTPDWRRRL